MNWICTAGCGCGLFAGGGGLMGNRAGRGAGATAGGGVGATAGGGVGATAGGDRDRCC